MVSSQLHVAFMAWGACDIMLMLVWRGYNAVGRLQSVCGLVRSRAVKLPVSPLIAPIMLPYIIP